MSRSRRLSKADDIAMLRYIIGYFKVYSGYPSIREIGDEFGLKSTSPTQHRLRRLTKAGYITRRPIIGRGMKVTPKGIQALREYDAEVKEATEAFSKGLKHPAYSKA